MMGDCEQRRAAARLNDILTWISLVLIAAWVGVITNLIFNRPTFEDSVLIVHRESRWLEDRDFVLGRTSQGLDNQEQIQDSLDGLRSEMVRILSVRPSDLYDRIKALEDKIAELQSVIEQANHEETKE